jgi:serine/tyrosine/threonine adenylyltransferase
VLVRLNHSHVRIGSFQRLAALGEVAELQRLVDYTLSRYFGGAGGPIDLLTHVVQRTSRLAGWFMAAGFVHGVLNSDNINVTGESFDYGPWRWTPRFEAGFTAAYFDEAGLYSYGRQAEAIHWDVAQLAISLTKLVEQEPLVAALAAFPDGYYTGLAEAMLWRLGVQQRGKDHDLPLITAMEKGLVGTGMSLDRFFFDWRGGRLRGATGEADYAGDAFAEFRAAIAGYEAACTLDPPYWAGDEPCSMLIEEVEAIWAPIADRDDWGLLEAKVEAVRAMGVAYRRGGSIDNVR